VTWIYSWWTKTANCRKELDIMTYKTKDKRQKNIDSTPMPDEQNGKSNKKIFIIAIIIVMVGGGTAYALFGLLRRFGDSTEYEIPTHTVKREDMRVTVSAGGTLQAMRSYEVKSEVEGATQILEIIPEGSLITHEDVEEGRVLLRLDDSQAREKVDEQEIKVQDASASYIEAKENLAIQEEQNKIDISMAELDVRFARMELELYLGVPLAQKAIKGEIDFDSSSWHDEIGGAALQERRDIENSVTLAREELARSQETLSWTRELVEKGYVNRNELDADELQTKRYTIELEQAETELDLFMRYTLARDAQQKLADYQKAKSNLQNTRARARSEIAQAKAKLNSRQATYRMQQERLERLYAMIENSIIRATRPGLIVYASTTNPRQFRNNPVEEGLTVREGQTIITMPDLSTLAARVEVPEAQAQMVKTGQNAKIFVDAMPDEMWDGVVHRIKPMATQQWGFLAMTGGGNKYETDVAFTDIDSNSTDLKPGMSATVEIEITEIPDALNIPIHAVTTRDGRHVCWVAGESGLELREVELGYYTDTHVQVRRGLKEGDKILLAPPSRIPRDIHIITLPENYDSGEGGDTEALPFPLEADDETRAEKAEGNEPEREIEDALTELDPEIRKQIEERMRDPQAREKIEEMLKDPDARKRIIDRIKGHADRKLQEERTGDGSRRQQQ
jgi:HlyD family secretion protein